MHLSVGILSRSSAFYSTRRLFHEAASRGLDVRIIHPGSIGRTKTNVPLHGEGKSSHGAPYPHLVIPRVGSRTTAEDLSALNTLTGAGVFSPIDAHAVDLAQDKLACSETLSQAGLAQLPMGLVGSVEDLKVLGERWDTRELVLKPRRGTQGQGVIRVVPQQVERDELDLYLDTYPEVIAQPFVPLKHPRDLRVLVLDGAILAHCWRFASPGEFRTNVHRGARTETTDVENSTLSLAIKACEALRLSFGGVDLLPTPAGPIVLEVNGSPGLEGIEKATSRNLAADIVRWACSRYRSHETLGITSGSQSSLSS